MAGRAGPAGEASVGGREATGEGGPAEQAAEKHGEATEEDRLAGEASEGMWKASGKTRTGKKIFKGPVCPGMSLEYVVKRRVVINISMYTKRNFHREYTMHI